MNNEYCTDEGKIQLNSLVAGQCFATAETASLVMEVAESYLVCIVIYPHGISIEPIEFNAEEKEEWKLIPISRYEFDSLLDGMIVEKFTLPRRRLDFALYP